MLALPRRLAFTPDAVTRRRRPLAGLVAAALVIPAGAACERTQGEVEINWTIVDRAGGQVFPSGRLGSTCKFTGVLPGGDAASDYALEVQLRLCEPDCPGGCDDPACHVDRLQYDCSAARGFSVVAARPEEPYDFHVDLVAAPADGGCGCTLTPPCALVPGPRNRTVEPGLVTDLQVYLLVLGLDNIAAAGEAGRTRLDLGECCTPDPSCAP